MEAILQGLTDQHEELDSILSGLDENAWAAPTPACPGWTVKDVVAHLVQTDELAIASLAGRLAEQAAELAFAGGDVDAAAEAAVAAERETPPGELHTRWRDTAGRLRAAFADTDASERVQWVAGTLAARTLCATRLSEAWIHTTDVAGAVGRELVPGDRLRHIARLAWRTLPYAFARAGQELTSAVELRLVAPDGELWEFLPPAEDEAVRTCVSGPALEWCLVAGRRIDPKASSLDAEGPDGEAVLALVRTYA